MKKALELLKTVKDFCIDYSFNIENDFDEAISELEALENRSCESCKHCRQFAELGLCDVLRGYTNMHLIKYCGRWESK